MTIVVEPRERILVLIGRSVFPQNVIIAVEVDIECNSSVVYIDINGIEVSLEMGVGLAAYISNSRLEITQLLFIV